MTIKYDSKFKKGVGDFFAIENQKEISYLRVDFFENKFPYVFSMHTLEGYKGKGSMESLLKYANKFYTNVTGEKLRSSIKPDEDVEGYWNRLEKKGLVKRITKEERKDFGRWIFR